MTKAEKLARWLHDAYVSVCGPAGGLPWKRLAPLTRQRLADIAELLLEDPPDFLTRHLAARAKETDRA